MPNIEDFSFESSTGKNTVRVRLCMPDAQPRAVIQIAHGIAEHIERYDGFMTFMASKGFIMVGNDHLGHGKSANTPDEKGIFAEKDGWSYVVKDMVKLHDIMHGKYPQLPYIMFGHSMGSFLTRNYIIDYPDKFDAAVLSGTGQQSKLLVGSGLLMAKLLTGAKGPNAPGDALDKIAFGSYCKRIDSPRTPYDWLSRDAAIVDAYVADPLCGYVCKISLYRDMMAGIKYITDSKNIAKMDMNKPIYFMSGAEDPVGDYGAGVQRAYKAFCNAGVKDVFMRLYPEGRHEMLNELNRAQVYEDIYQWVDSKL